MAALSRAGRVVGSVRRHPVVSTSRNERKRALRGPLRHRLGDDVRRLLACRRVGARVDVERHRRVSVAHERRDRLDVDPAGDEEGSVGVRRSCRVTLLPVVPTRSRDLARDENSFPWRLGRYLVPSEVSMT